MADDEHREAADEIVDSSTVRRVFRRQTSRSQFQFVDDLGHVLGMMTRQSFLLINGTTTTEAGSFRSVGTGFNPRMEDSETGERILGRGIGWRLPDGEELSVHMSRPRSHLFALHRVLRYRFELRDSTGAVVIELSWLPPVAPFRGKFPNGQAVLARELQPTVELVPLLSYAFQKFQGACQPSGGA
jgi:hypothetical protein